MPASNQKEQIDIRILRLIGLEDVFDIDYDTYKLLLKEVLVKNSIGKSRLADEERDLLVGELKRIHGSNKKGRFEVKKNKKISSQSFNVGKTKNKLVASKQVKGILPQAKISEKFSLKNQLEESLSSIALSFNSILDTLKKQEKVSEDSSEYDRKKKEQEKRSLSESKLEKRFGFIKKAAEKVIAPVKSVLDRIIQFFTQIILGRIVFKLIEWMGDPKNASKIKSIIRFFKDFGPSLLSLYIIFGTSFGKFARGLISLVVGGGRRLIAATAALAVKAGIGKAGGKLSKVAGFFGGRKGKLLSAGLQAGATVAGTVALSKTLEGGIGGPQQKSQGFSGGGYVRPRFPAFSGGGFNFSGMMGGASLGAMFGPLGMLLGGAFGSGKPQQIFGGFVSGEKGVDKIPAMLSDGEFVMSRGAVKKYGVDTLEAMNAAGGGTNKPKIVNGVPHAYEGGRIGSSSSRYGNDRPKNYEYYINEILKGLSPHYNWASSLAKRAGVGAQNYIEKNASGLYNVFMSEGAKAHGYLTRGGIQGDLNRAGSGAIRSGNDAYNYLSSKEFQSDLMSKGTRLLNQGQTAVTNAISSVEKMQLGKKYQDMSERNQQRTNKKIDAYDSWMKGLPEGFLKETLNRGLIPVPTFGAKSMTLATFAKAMAGPLGRPFRIMTNDVVDRARQEMIDKTSKGSGLRVDPKTGRLSMDWNRVATRGSGQYTDKFSSLGNNAGEGKFFNSTFGRWSGYQKGDKMVTSDIYNFNETIGQYAKKSKDSLMRGDVGSALYNLASVAGRFAQDVGWMNQRVLGSEVEVGSIKNIDPKTGRPRIPHQKSKETKEIQEKGTYTIGGVKYDVKTGRPISSLERERKNEQKLISNRPWWDKMGWFGGASAQMKRNQKPSSTPKANFVKPPSNKNNLVKPPSNPKITVIKGGSSKKNQYRGGQRSSRVKTPNITAINPAANNSKRNVLAITS